MRRIRVALAGLLASALLTATLPFAPVAAADETTAANTGIAIPGNWLAWESEAQMNADLDRVASSGARWIRFDIPWSELSWGHGHMDWTRYDRVVDGARARGLEPLAILGSVPPHLRPAGTPVAYAPANDAERAAFADYTRQVVKRYNGRIKYYEVWNEPNLDQNWHPTPDPASYVRLLRVVSPAIRGACGGCTIVTGGTGGSQGGRDISPLDWYRGFYAHNPQSLYDAVGTHPYYFHTGTGRGGEMSILPELRRLMNANGDSNKELWATEIGTPTAGQHAVSQADGTRMMYEAVDAWNSVQGTGPMFWYTLRDREQDDMGLLNRDGSPKPVWHTLVDIIRRSPGATSGSPQAARMTTTSQASEAPAPSAEPVRSTRTAVRTMPSGEVEGQVSLRTEGKISTSRIVIAMRDAHGNNRDVHLGNGQTLSGDQSFTALRQPIAAGTYRYRFAYETRDGVWHEVGDWQTYQR